MAKKKVSNRLLHVITAANKVEESCFHSCVCLSVHNQDTLKSYQWIYTKLAVNDQHKNISDCRVGF